MKKTRLAAAVAVVALLVAASMAVYQPPVAAQEVGDWLAIVTYIDVDGVQQQYARAFLDEESADVWAELAVHRGFNRRWSHGGDVGNTREFYPANRIRLILTKAR